MKPVFQLDGRANRGEMWTVYLAGAVLAMVCFAALWATLGFFALFFNSSGMLSVVALVGSGLVIAGGALAMLATMVRRMHDVNRSGWWIVVYGTGCLATFVGNAADIGPTPLRMALAGATVVLGLFLAGVVFLFPGTPGRNRFGPSTDRREQSASSDPSVRP
jgi:uncharacterized membrane protein YhaH (DUF805 family)